MSRLSGAVLLLTSGLLAPGLRATIIPPLGFEELTDASEYVVSGTITYTWMAWDSEHKYIWTHYLMTVSSSAKGAPVATLQFAEPGGHVGGNSMAVPGAPGYKLTENVAIFLSRMPNGFLRTTGWTQGKYSVDSGGILHATGAGGSVVLSGTGAAKRFVDSAEGITFAELKRRVAARLIATGKGGAR